MYPTAWQFVVFVLTLGVVGFAPSPARPIQRRAPPSWRLLWLLAVAAFLLGITLAG